MPRPDAHAPDPGQRGLRTGILAGTAAYGIWGLFPFYFHQLDDVSAAEIVCLRILTTFAVTWAALGVTGDLAWVRPLLSRPGDAARVAAAGLMVTTNWAVYVWAVTADRVVEGAIGYYINPLVTVALGVVLLHERLRSLQKAALAFGAAAVVVLTIAYGRLPWVSLVLAGSFGLYGYLKKSVSLPGLQALAVETTAVLPLAAAGLIVLSATSGLDAGHTAALPRTLLVLLGVVTAVPLVLFGAAARRIPLSLLGLLQYLTPTLQLMSGLALGEHVPFSRWIGVALVWVALVLLALDALRTATGRTAAARIGAAAVPEPAPVAEPAPGAPASVT